MRLISSLEPGKVEFNFMWAPTFIGLDNRLKQELEKKLAPEFKGRPLTEEVLDEAHERVIALILEKYPLEGLRDYLDALKFVQG